ncbi:MAG: hypothetical protein L6R40_002966 [Gallowayella cf. fulva]|nr:MAG: hypothetical protein L6R40_002966 [Xanthomendoza cf. fulva]
MAPAKRRAKVRMVRERSTSADDENEATTDDVRGSQGSDDQSVSNMAKALKESSRRRRKARRSKIEKEYRHEMEQLEISVAANLNDISSKSLKMHESRLERLKALLDKRAMLETEMEQNAATLERAFANVNQELQAVLVSRIQSNSVEK